MKPVVFYFITSNDLVLNKEATDRIALQFALDLGIDNYRVRSGIELQDPLKFAEEVGKPEDIDSYDIIYLNDKNKSSTMLSDKQKEEFLNVIHSLPKSNSEILKDILQFVDWDELNKILPFS